MKLSGVSNAAPFGPDTTNGFLQITNNAIKLAKNSVGGYFILCVVWYGDSSVYINMPYYVLQNARSIEGPTFMNDTNRCTTAINIQYFEILDSSQDTIINIDTINFQQCVLPTNSTATLLLTQTSSFIENPSVIDAVLPKVSYCTFKSPSNSYPLNYYSYIVNQFGISITSARNANGGSITIPGTTSKPFLLLLTWSSSNSSTYKIPGLNIQNLTTYGTYFNNINSTISNTLCLYISELFYMGIFTITDPNAGNAVITLDTSGKIPTDSGSLYMFELNL